MLVGTLSIFQLLAGIYNPGDGHIDPYSLTQSLAAGARLYGAEIYLDTIVSGLLQRQDGGWDVVTPRGTVKTKHVINAAGKQGL